MQCRQGMRLLPSELLKLSSEITAAILCESIPEGGGSFVPKMCGFRSSAKKSGNAPQSTGQNGGPYPATLICAIMSKLIRK